LLALVRPRVGQACPDPLVLRDQLLDVVVKIRKRAANGLYVVLKTGVIRQTRELLDFQEGDLKMTLDLRRVDASMLGDWLGLPSRTALHRSFDPLPLFSYVTSR
jgi:hypothetical protein